MEKTKTKRRTTYARGTASRSHGHSVTGVTAKMVSDLWRQNPIIIVTLAVAIMAFIFVFIAVRVQPVTSLASSETERILDYNEALGQLMNQPKGLFRHLAMKAIAQQRLNDFASLIQQSSSETFSSNLALPIAIQAELQRLDNGSTRLIETRLGGQNGITCQVKKSGTTTSCTSGSTIWVLYGNIDGFQDGQQTTISQGLGVMSGVRVITQGLLQVGSGSDFASGDDFLQPLTVQNPVTGNTSVLVVADKGVPAATLAQNAAQLKTVIERESYGKLSPTVTVHPTRVDLCTQNVSSDARYTIYVCSDRAGGHADAISGTAARVSQELGNWVHELGHLIGLRHSNDGYMTANFTVGNEYFNVVNKYQKEWLTDSTQDTVTVSSGTEQVTLADVTANAGVRAVIIPGCTDVQNGEDYFISRRNGQLQVHCSMSGTGANALDSQRIVAATVSGGQIQGLSNRDVQVRVLANNQVEVTVNDGGQDDDPNDGDPDPGEDNPRVDGNVGNFVNLGTFGQAAIVCPSAPVQARAGAAVPVIVSVAGSGPIQFTVSVPSRTPPQVTPDSSTNPAGRVPAGRRGQMVPGVLSDPSRPTALVTTSGISQDLSVSFASTLQPGASGSFWIEGVTSVSFAGTSDPDSAYPRYSSCQVPFTITAAAAAPSTVNLYVDGSRDDIVRQLPTNVSLTWMGRGFCTLRQNGAVVSHPQNPGINPEQNDSSFRVPVSSPTTFVLDCGDFGRSEVEVRGLESLTTGQGAGGMTVDIQAFANGINLFQGGTVTAGTAVDFLWESTNANSCSVNPIGWTGANGSSSLSLTNTIALTLTCTNGQGSATDTLRVNVTGGSAPNNLASIVCVPHRIVEPASLAPYSITVTGYNVAGSISFQPSITKLLSQDLENRTTFVGARSIGSGKYLLDFTADFSRNLFKHNPSIIRVNGTDGSGNAVGCGGIYEYLSVGSDGIGSIDDDRPVAGDIGINPNSLRINVGAQGQATISGGTPPYRAQSDNPDIAQIVSATNGVLQIRGVNAGRAMIRVYDSFISPLGFGSRYVDLPVDVGAGGGGGGDQGDDGGQDDPPSGPSFRLEGDTTGFDGSDRNSLQITRSELNANGFFTVSAVGGGPRDIDKFIFFVDGVKINASLLTCQSSDQPSCTYTVDTTAWQPGNMPHTIRVRMVYVNGTERNATITVRKVAN